MSGFISWQDVDRAFGGSKALARFTLDVDEGAILCLVGPSGCGKTTALRVLAGFDRPDAGRVEIRGRTVVDGSSFVPPERRSVGMVFQDYALMPWRTVEKNVAMPFEFIAHPFSDKEIQEQVYQVIRNVGLDGFEKSFPHELSGGMRQRVGIARAMVTQPKLLLADEPFGALDAMTREVLQGQLEKLVMESGQTVIFITHSIDEAISLGDRIAVISHRPGTVREIVEVNIERPRLAEGEITQHPDYGPLRQHLWDLVKDEALGAKSEDVA